MKITQSTLRKIIREELETVVSEAVPKSTHRGKVKNKKTGRTGMVSNTRQDKLGLMMTVVYRDGETPKQETLYASDLEALNEAYKSGAQRDKEMNADIRMIKKDPEFRALVALEKAYHGRKRSIDDETPTVRYILLRRSDRKAMDPAAAMNNVIQDMSPGLHKFAANSEAMQPYFGAVNEGDLNPEFRKNVRGALENEQLFVYVRNAGIPMRNVNRAQFFSWLRRQGWTTPEAIEDNRALIAGWLKKNR